MDATAQPAPAPEPADATPSPLQAKAEMYRAQLAGTLRSLAAVSNAAASNLESYGQLGELTALIATIDRLQAHGGGQLSCFGAALASAGTA